MKKFLSLLFVSLFFISEAYADNLRFAQITDVRFSMAEDNSCLKNTIKEINKQKNIEFVVFTGDNISKPSIDELGAFLKEIKKLNCPYYLVIGDKEVNKLKHLSKLEYCAYLKKHIKKYKPETPNYTFEKNGVIFMVADGAKDVIPSPNGYFKDDVLNRLDNELSKYPNNNVIILQHFPIIPPAQKETYFTAKPEKYLEMLDRHKNVKAVISGHFGVNKEQNERGIVHISTSSIPYYRVIDILDCNTDNPSIWAELRKAE